MTRCCRLRGCTQDSCGSNPLSACWCVSGSKGPTAGSNPGSCATCNTNNHSKSLWQRLLPPTGQTGWQKQGRQTPPCTSRCVCLPRCAKQTQTIPTSKTTLVPCCPAACSVRLDAPHAQPTLLQLAADQAGPRDTQNEVPPDTTAQKGGAGAGAACCLLLRVKFCKHSAIAALR